MIPTITTKDKSLLNLAKAGELTLRSAEMVFKTPKIRSYSMERLQGMGFISLNVTGQSWCLTIEGDKLLKFLETKNKKVKI